MSAEQQQEVRTGGCLCGTVRYRVRGAAAYDTFCHCINCQKITGSVALTASICFREGFEITSGEEHLKSYSDKATDSGKALRRCFCSECGSNLFAFTPLREDIVGVAAGSLDNFEAWKPNTEQYCMHRATFLEKIKGVDPSRRFVASVAQSQPEAQ